jgi:hypothetical protein
LEGRGRQRKAKARLMHETASSIGQTGDWTKQRCTRRWRRWRSEVFGSRGEMQMFQEMRDAVAVSRSQRLFTD